MLFQKEITDEVDYYDILDGLVEISEYNGRKYIIPFRATDPLMFFYNKSLMKNVPNDFDEVIEYSSNIGMAKIGQRLGKEKLYDYIRRFGFNSQTGIDLPGEARGLLKNPYRWSGLSAPIISFNSACPHFL